MVCWKIPHLYNYWWFPHYLFASQILAFDLRRCLWRCPMSSQGRMKGSRFPPLDCKIPRGWFQGNFPHLPTASLAWWPQLTFRCFHILSYFNMFKGLKGETSKFQVSNSHQNKARAILSWGDSQWRLGRDHVLQSPERQAACAHASHLLCRYESQNDQLHLDHGAGSIRTLGLLKLQA